MQSAAVIYLADSHSGCTNVNMCIPAPSGFVFNNIPGLFFPREISVFKAKPYRIKDNFYIILSKQKGNIL